jgi:hypothetical protein
MSLRLGYEKYCNNIKTNSKFLRSVNGQESSLLNINFTYYGRKQRIAALSLTKTFLGICQPPVPPDVRPHSC